MTFALTAFVANGQEVDEAVTKRFRQRAVLTITAANTNVALDFGTYAGTFWTAVGASTVGAAALKAIKDIQTRAKTFVKAGGSGLANYSQADASNISVLQLSSAASGGGAATEALTVTGLKTTDTIIAVTQSTKGGASLPLLGWSTQVADGITGIWSADVKTGAIVQVAFTRSVTTVVAGSYTLTMDGTNTNIPNILFLSGDAPTAYNIVLEWELNQDQPPVQVVSPSTAA